MKSMNRFFIVFLSLALNVTYSQSLQIKGRITGKLFSAVKEVQIIYDGNKIHKLPVNKSDSTFSGYIKMKEGQFVELKSGNNVPQYYYMIPNESVFISIEKPSLQESIVQLRNERIELFNSVFKSYYAALEDAGIDTKARDWPKLLFSNNTILLTAENRLNQAMLKSGAALKGVPSFATDMRFFMQSFRNYTLVDQFSLVQIDSILLAFKKSAIKPTVLNIPYVKEYLTDLTNAYAARTLEKYGLALDYIKQKHINQFIAAEAINQYVPNQAVKSYLFSEKLRVELPVNGLKNETYVDFLLTHSDQYVRDFHQEKLNQLKASKLPDLNTARKRAFDFTLQDSTGKVYKLDDFKGKTVFIDFWASWCAPCRAQIPYQKELEKLYSGKDIVFLGVSLDKSKQDWLKAVQEEGLHGYILHAEGDFKNPFPKAYGVNAIPRYMLIDAAGNIVSDNMLKPQNKKEIMAIFDEELYAKNTIEILEKHFKAIGADVLMKNGLRFDYTQTVPGIKANNTVYYKYPDKMKMLIRYESNEQMVLMMGADFFKEKFAIMNGKEVNTNIPGQSDIRDTWVNKMFGFELFLRKTLNNAVVKFAEESGTGADSAYVLKLAYKNQVEKYYINKRTYLIDKIVVLTTAIEPRRGGGTYENFVSYSDYKNVQGLMLPQRANAGNISSFRITSTELGNLDASLFRVLQKE